MHLLMHQPHAPHVVSKTQDSEGREKPSAKPSARTYVFPAFLGLGQLVVRQGRRVCAQGTAGTSAKARSCRPARAGRRNADADCSQALYSASTRGFVLSTVQTSLHAPPWLRARVRTIKDQ